MKTKSIKKQGVLALSLLTMLLGTNAFAQNSALADNGLLISSRPVISSDRVTQIGQATGSFENLRGFAKDLPLITVLKQITPNGWIVKKDDTKDNRLDVQKLTSWDGGKTWPETLSAVAQDADLKVVLNWNTKEIVVSPAPVALAAPSSTLIQREDSRFANKVNASNSGVFELGSAPAVRPMLATASLPAPKQVETQPIEITSGGSSLPAPVVTGVLVSQEPVAPLMSQAPVSSDWTLSPGKSLKENVEEWGKKAGYKVVWNGEDYPVDSIRTITGEFDGDNGPVKQLSLDYGPESRVQQPLAFQFYQNRTLVIEDFRFEQQGNPQYMQ